MKPCNFNNSFNIREHITPKGDGNVFQELFKLSFIKIREHITPKGDGNDKILSTFKFLSFKLENI